jgi:hypothetical protein
MSIEGIGTDRQISPLEREEVARIEVGQTTISPALARLLIAAFLARLAALPLVETLGPVDAARPSRPWSHLLELPAAVARAPSSDGAEAASTPWRRLVMRNRVLLAGLSAFETALEDASRVGRLLRPPAQAMLSGWLGAGNERVYIGTDGWLFYRPDVEYLTGPGFLDPAVLSRRVAAAEYATPPQPDPRPAIRQFARDVAARGSTLVVMPTPVKPSVHPDRLAPGAAGRPLPMQNPSYDAFVTELRRDGILVFDPAQAIVQAAPGGRPQYLMTDTHWRPESMRLVAEALAAYLATHVPLPPVPPPGYRLEPRAARQTGDTAAMLDLPPRQTLYPPEGVALDFVLGPDAEPWRPTRAADVLVLGDSFSNMYSLATMGWGEAAGFIEHLSVALQRPVDRIVQNDEGAAATRRLLRREVGGDPDRLRGTRVVIWQFAARELAFGDWTVMPLPEAAAR